MTLDEHRARMIVHAAHAAWCRADIEGVLAQYTDNLTYWINSAPDGGPLMLEGKDALRSMLNSVVEVAESVSVPEYFRFNDGKGRATIEAYIRHKTTGHTLVGSYRQVVTFRGDRIASVEEYHDAARMIAFWKMISGEAAIEKALLAVAG
jgi:ketosteroid isomerase-like protein